MNVTVEVCFACKAGMASVKSFCAFCCILNSQTVSLSFSVVSKKVAYFLCTGPWKLVVLKYLNIVLCRSDILRRSTLVSASPAAAALI